MKKIILMVLTMFVVVGCGGGGGDSSTTSASDSDSGDSGGGTATSSDGAKADVPISVDVVVPPTEVPDGDELQACVAIDAVSVTDIAGTITEWTTKSMNNPDEISNKQCIPADSSIPVDNDGYPKFIVIDLHDLTGVDIIQLISDQLVAAGEYTGMSLSVIQGTYDSLIGDTLGQPQYYSYVGDALNKQYMEVVDELSFDGLDINIDVPTTYTMTFDLRSMLQMLENAYYLKNKGLRLVDNLMAATIYGDVDPATCDSADNAYVYLYDSDDSGYGDLGSDNPPVSTAKVIDNQYSMGYVPEGTYDVLLACNALADLPNQIDLDIDLDEDSMHDDQSVSGGQEYYKPF